MGELTVPQPLATLAVMSAVTVLVVPEPPKCHECGGSGEVERWGGGGRGRRRRPFWGRHCCRACDGDGLARWPAEVTIRSSDEEPWVNYEGRGDGYGPFRTRRNVGAFYLTDMRDGKGIPLPLGEVVGSVTVEAAVPILGADDIIEESCGWVSVLHRSAYLLVQSESGEHRHGDISDQLAFQDFPVGHTALILAGETDP